MGWNGDFLLKKIRRNWGGGRGWVVRNISIRWSKKSMKKHNNLVFALCKFGEISRASYYKWLNCRWKSNDKLNQQLADKLEKLHQQHPNREYRRLNDKLYHDENIIVNDKRIFYICRKRQIKFNLKYHYDGGIRYSKKLVFIVNNVLSMDFVAEHPNEKWATDVTEVIITSRVFLKKFLIGIFQYAINE